VHKLSRVPNPADFQEDRISAPHEVERFREVSEPLIAAMGEALDDATEYGNGRRGYAACALTDVLHASSSLH
jgi:hypothetical protein